MTEDTRPRDKIDDAIQGAAVHAPGMETFKMAFKASGRPALLVVPIDLTDDEAFNLYGLVGQAIGQLRSIRPAPSPLVVARGRVGR